MGALRSWPEFLYLITTHGFYHTVCISTMYKGVSGFWTYLFVMSKLIELGENEGSGKLDTSDKKRVWNQNEASLVRKLITVDSAFNELGYNEISEFLKIHFFKTDFSQQRYYNEEGQDFIFPWSFKFTVHKLLSH